MSLGQNTGIFKNFLLSNFYRPYKLEKNYFIKKPAILENSKN